MKRFTFIIAVLGLGIAVGLPVPALAQVDATAQTQTTTVIQTQTTTTTDRYARSDSHWLASAFVGSNFGEDADDASLDFGGTVGYLWRGIVGGEFQANLSPEFEFEGSRRALLLGEEPWLNSYMFNAIGAIPFGNEGRFQPFVSGGLGVLTLRADTLITNGEQNEFEPDDSRFGGNIGGGVFGYVGGVGIRGDVRYFRGFSQNFDTDAVDSAAEAIGNQILSDLAFWRANIGLAFRW